ncbi:MAG: DUF1579 domain-containing protein [Sphingomonas sp.]
MKKQTPADLPSGAHDFDFLHGSWTVAHARLATRLSASSDWEHFSGTTIVRPILGGLGNFDENTIDLPAGAYRASTLRLFDPETALWSLHWIDSRRMHLDPPLQGSFADGVGLFFGDDHHDGTPIRIRFTWTAPTVDCARWEQAFSIDDGASWEANWVMDFTRAAREEGEGGA